MFIAYSSAQMFFATSILHVHLMQWDDVSLVEQAVNRCNVVWDSIELDKVSTPPLPFEFDIAIQH